MIDSRRPPIGGILLGFAGFWLALIVLFAAQTSMAIGQSWTEALGGALGLWLPWILVSPCMLAAALFLPFHQRVWRRNLAIHLIACVAIVFAGGWLSRNFFGPPLPPHPPGMERGFPPPGLPPAPPGDFSGPGENRTAEMNNFLRSLPVGIPLYVTTVLLIGILNLRRISKERELQAADLERQLTEARLQTLVSQLQPHFLFNTLNTLVSLISRSPAQAEAVILNLSSLLRATLEAREKPLIPLRREVELARDYFEIQLARFGDKLKVGMNISPDTLSCAIPPLILQPLLENAVKYTSERNPAGARIKLRSKRAADKLLVEIEDSGGGSGTHFPSGHGVGLSNVRSRLQASFPGQHVACDLIPNEIGGMTVRLEMPVMAAN